MFVRISLATALVAALLCAAPAAHAGKIVPCTFDPDTGEMVVSAAGKAPSVALKFDEDGTIRLNGNTCSDEAVLGTVDHARFTGGPDLKLTLDGRGGTFSPGRTADPDGVSEVQFRFDPTVLHLSVRVLGTTEDDRIVAGDEGLDLTGDGDTDLFHTDITALTLEGVSGDDRLSTRGGGSVGGPLVAETRLDGGTGDDTLLQTDLGASGYHALLIGGLGDDRLEGVGAGVAADYATSAQGVRVDLGTGLANGQGTDRLVGIQSAVGSPFGDKLISGGLAGSLLGGAGNDLLVAGRGRGVLDGGTGRDFASYGQARRGVRVSLAGGGSADWGPRVLLGIEGLFGSREHDVLTGSGHRNRLNGGGGDDTIMGGAGADTLQGGAGSDLLLGGTGTDLCREGAGEGRMRGCER